MTEVQIPGFGGKVDRHPDQCPLCHNKIIPTPRYGHLSGSTTERRLEIAYTCPSAKCEGLFIAYFTEPDARLAHDAFDLRSTAPWRRASREFPDSIRSMSPDFCEIYNEALAAEHYRLIQICGVGYRKSLEFLIKDYVIAKHPNDADRIKNALLGACIETYVTDRNIKEVTKRATWLGNDEAHYERRWLDKDLSDLKRLIDLVLYWIQAEQLTAEAIRSMQPSSR
jgi:hypothetical protein